MIECPNTDCARSVNLIGIAAEPKHMKFNGKPTIVTGAVVAMECTNCGECWEEEFSKREKSYGSIRCSDK